MADKQIVLVTGGTGGIGQAMVKKYVDEGYFVVFTYNSKEAEAQEIIEKSNGCAVGYKVNVKNSDEIKKCVDDVVGKYGSIHILVNNAGITDDDYFMMMNESRWKNVLSINLGGCFSFTSEVLPHMLSSRNGVIINMSSVSGIGGQVGQCNYSASKAGMIGFTKSLAKEMAHKNIRVNAVAPGFIDTEMIHKIGEQKLKAIKQGIPMKRFGNTKEIADAVFFLTSEAASYITGQVLVVDGGLT